MTRSELVKVRVTPRAKAALSQIAARRSSTVSGVMRDLLAEVEAGRSISPAVRSDMLAIRQLANALLACAETLDARAPVTGRLTATAASMRKVAERHLGPA